MACGCEIYVCLLVDYNPCDNNVTLPISADETGDWVILIEFDGTWIRLLIEVTDGEPIVFPNVLNEYYVHAIRLLNTTKEVYNDTCYKVITKVVTASQIPAINPIDNRETYAITFTGSASQAEYQSALLIGAEILFVTIENNTITNIIFDSATGILTLGLNISDGAIIYVLYKK